MIVYRLCKEDHIALDGEGARLFGGRWNAAGRSMVYTAASPSLALLEVLVHLDLTADLLPDDLRMLAIEVPDDAVLQRLSPSPADDHGCRDAGTQFLQDGAALGLMVQSVVVPQEYNLLLNPRHKDMERVRICHDEAFAVDPRFFA